MGSFTTWGIHMERVEHNCLEKDFKVYVRVCVCVCLSSLNGCKLVISESVSLYTSLFGGGLEVYIQLHPLDPSRLFCEDACLLI